VSIELFFVRSIAAMRPWRLWIALLHIVQAFFFRKSLKKREVWERPRKYFIGIQEMMAKCISGGLTQVVLHGFF